MQITQTLHLNAEVSTTNYLASTSFKQIDLQLNNEHIISINDYYYVSMLEVLLSYDHNAKDTWLQAGLFYKDKAGHFDTLSNNREFMQRTLQYGNA